jgi:hypothetical protein
MIKLYLNKTFIKKLNFIKNNTNGGKPVKANNNKKYIILNLENLLI